MKYDSTRAPRTLVASLALALGALVAGCAHSPAPSAGGSLPATADSTAPATASTAARPLPTRANLVAQDLSAHMQPNAPRRYVVKRGDTLWDIAGRYLDDPWYWPQLWQGNPEIRNPNLIYPGEVLVLGRSVKGRPVLHGERTERLSPQIREQSLAAAIPTIPYSAIRDFLDSPRLVDARALSQAPYIVSFEDQHLVAGKGATVYVRGAKASGPHRFQIVRGDGPYRDSRSGKILGQQALPIGQLTLTRFGNVDTGVIDQSSREALTGDRLLPLRQQDLIHDFHPRAPAQPLAAHIISVYGGVTSIGQYDVVTLDHGSNNGLRRGDVLDVYAAGRAVIDPVAGGQVKLPQVQSGQLMVFKTEARVAFALIMRATRAIHVDDVARSP